MIKEMCEKFSDEIYAINLQYYLESGKVPKGNQSVNVNPLGVSAGYFVTNDLTMLSGRMFSKEELESGKKVALVSDKLVNKIFNGDAKKALGEEIVLETSGESSQFTIIGVYEYQANYMMGAALGSGDDVTTNLYMPLKAAFNYEHSEAYYQYVQVTTEAGVDADLLASKIENFFEPYYRNNRTSELNAITVGINAYRYVINDNSCYFHCCWNSTCGWRNRSYEYNVSIYNRKNERNRY